jgi:hypothetical protein
MGIDSYNNQAETMIEIWRLKQYEIRWFWNLRKGHGNDGPLLQGYSEF